MSDVLYICIECELAGRSADPAPLTSHSLCRACGSSSVVPVDSLVELAAKQKRESEAPLSPTDVNTRLRVQVMKDQRRRDSEPLRTWLKGALPPPDRTTEDWAHSKGIVTSVTKALEEWDGWAWHVNYPWDVSTEVEATKHFTIELVQGVKNGPRWLITLDEASVASVAEVKSSQDGTD